MTSGKQGIGNIFGQPLAKATADFIELVSFLLIEKTAGPGSAGGVGGAAEVVPIFVKSGKTESFTADIEQGGQSRVGGSGGVDRR